MHGCHLLKADRVKIGSSFLQMWTVSECFPGWQMILSSGLEIQHRAGDKLVSSYTFECVGRGLTVWLATKAFLVTVWWPWLFPLSLQPSRSESKVWWRLLAVTAWLSCTHWLGKVGVEMQCILASDCLSSENKAQCRETSPTCNVKW